MEKEKNKKKLSSGKKAVLGVAALAAAFGIGIGGASAYFSAQSATVSNDVSIVAGKDTAGKDDTGVDGTKGALKIYETNWVKTGKDQAQRMEPGKTAEKDPVIKSNVAYDGYVVAQVRVPEVVGSLTDAEGQDVLDMFTLEGTNTSDWTKLDAYTVDGNGYKLYYYGYNKVLPTTEETSSPVFTQIKEQNFKNIAKDGKDGSQSADSTGKITDSVDVTAAIIQTTDHEVPNTANSTAQELVTALQKLNKSNNAGDPLSK